MRVEPYDKRAVDSDTRCRMIAMVEKEHVTQYESMPDPGKRWFEQLVLHEYNECYMYHSFAGQESDPWIRAVGELRLAMEIEQLRIAADPMRRLDGWEAAEVLPEPVLLGRPEER